MPLILDPTDYKDWLSTDNKDEIKNLLQTFTKQEIINYPISKSLFSNTVDSNVFNILDRVEFQKGLF
jgi:putative SOS response-associated peptidase YedK